MNTFASRPVRERLELISQTAAKLDMAPAAIEKDFWVCWMLQRLFESPLRDSIIFKGGYQPFQSVWLNQALFGRYRLDSELERIL